MIAIIKNNYFRILLCYIFYVQFSSVSSYYGIIYLLKNNRSESLLCLSNIGTGTDNVP